ncbi:phospholipase A-2-activating protein [Anabrus simplex]|uniref:phospholipase A-2-activating protein n=1 Tax=Anabrus simplex TaxID=316456 RepID=UPI0034DCD34D
MASAPYKLSCVLYGHTLDVRCIAVTQEGYIVSGSRDRSAKIWKPNGINTGYSEIQSLLGHKNFVSCVCVLPPDSRYPSGLIVTGSNDNSIRIFSLDSPQPLCVLSGHTNAVCSLSPGVQNGTLLSASWDTTARLWKTDGSTTPILTVSGHQAAVWSAIQLASGDIITGSADKTLKVWLSSGIYQKTLTGHMDCVRGLAATSANEFLSCSNDATVRHWNATTGDCLGCFYGHSNYIYSISVFPKGGAESFVTSGEDRSVRIWTHGEVEQTITLPAQSVWSVACLANGDIAVGSSDGVLRVFSCDPSRQAEPDLLKQFDEQVESTNLSSDLELGGVKMSELPGQEALSNPGHTDGQTKLVREGTTVICYSWSAASKEWIKVGDVMGASGGTQATSGKQLYNGKEYDYVFSVDVEDGKPPLKLPYNKNEDPWFAAQKFIHDNNLSQLYLDQVANFIVKNSQDTSLPNPASSSTTPYCDPFTGGSRYIPGSGSGGEIPATGADPFTGASRYVPSIWSATNGVAGSGTDPFTGDSSYQTSTSKMDSCPVKPYFPQKMYIRFDQANLKMILEKLLELNRKTGDGSHTVEESCLEEVVKLGDLGASANLQYLQVLKQLLEWPKDIVFPVLDVTRLAVRNAEINSYLCSGQTGDQLMELLQRFLLPDSLTANQMLTLRIICNMLSHPDGEALALKHRDYLLSALLELLPPSNKQVQIAMATLLLNFAVAFNRIKDLSAQSQAMTVTVQVLPHLSDTEAQFRGLVALGTLIWDADDANLVNHATSSSDLGVILKQLSALEKSSDPQSQSAALKVAQCAAQVTALLKK